MLFICLFLNTLNSEMGKLCSHQPTVLFLFSHARDRYWVPSDVCTERISSQHRAT